MERTTRWRAWGCAAGGLVAAVWLTGCQTPPAAKPADVPPPPAEAAPPAPAAPPVATEPPPAGPAAVQQAQRLAVSAVEMLEQGHEDAALAEIQRALQADPANRLALSLQKQAQGDPQQLLGREYFMYRVPAGESLSRIAGRFLGDVHLFYALARYNDIKVPRQLQGGQMIKVPGKAAPPSAPPPAALPPASPPPGPAATPVPAPQPAAAAPGAGAAAPGAAAASAAPRLSAAEAAAAQHYRQGLALMAQQKPAEAIEAFDKVLEADPQHANAKLRRAQAVNQVGALIRLLENSIRRLDGQIAKDPANAQLKAQRDKAVLERERFLTVK